MHRLIDFDEKLEKHLQSWVEEHRDEYEKIDDMEADVPEETLKWLNTPADWLDGNTPGDFFAQYSDSQDLVQWMTEYLVNGVSLPDPLLDRIADLSDPEPLAAVLREKMASRVCTEDEELVMTCISLLSQMGAETVADLYIRYIVQNGDDSVSDAADEALYSMKSAREPMLKALGEEMSESSRTALLDALTHQEPDPAVYDWLVRMFLETEEQKALYASYLGRYGDPRAINVLKQVIEEPGLNYLEFIEIRNAIEELGGEIILDRDFEGDQYYETMKDM